MIILLTENSPIAMLTLSSMEGAIINFFPLGIYTDPLYEISNYLDLCNHIVIPRAINICNNTPWSDMIWSQPKSLALAESKHDRAGDVLALKKKIYNACGWKPNAIINVYDGVPCAKWRAKIYALTQDDVDITVINLNAADPKFARNIVDAVEMLLNNYLDAGLPGHKESGKNDPGIS